MDTPRISVTVAVAALAGVLGLVLLGMGTTMRLAVLALALYLCAGAVARVLLPASRTLAVRRRAVDVAVLLTLAAALVFLGLTTPLD